MYYNKSNRYLHNKFYDHLMCDIGVDLFTETVEISSDNISHNDFKIKIDKLQLATKNIELDSEFYIIRKVFNKFYTITELNRLYMIEYEDNDDTVEDYVEEDEAIDEIAQDALEETNQTALDEEDQIQEESQEESQEV